MLLPFVLQTLRVVELARRTWASLTRVLERRRTSWEARKWLELVGRVVVELLTTIDGRNFELSSIRVRMHATMLTNELRARWRYPRMPIRFEVVEMNGWAHSKLVDYHHHHHLHLFYG